MVSVSVVWQFIRMRQVQFLRCRANRDCQKLPKANTRLGSCSGGGSGLRLRSVELTKTGCYALNLERAHVELALKQLVCRASSAAYRGRSHVCNNSFLSLDSESTSVLLVQKIVSQPLQGSLFLTCL